MQQPEWLNEQKLQVLQEAGLLALHLAAPELPHPGQRGGDGADAPEEQVAVSATTRSASVIAPHTSTMPKASRPLRRTQYPSASIITSIAQCSQGLMHLMTIGTGTVQGKPSSKNTINGTHTQCTSLLAGFWWLSPYSDRRAVSVAMAKAGAVGTGGTLKLTKKAFPSWERLFDGACKPVARRYCRT